MSKNGRQFTKHGQNSPEFISKYTKQRKKNKIAKKSRTKNRGK